MKDKKIDLVYIWVDDKDIKWQKKKQKQAIKHCVEDSKENNICRYANNDELIYSLRSAEMFAPWINKIFIVTDSQIPVWLDTNHPKIKIIDHKEIMPADCLPCFNSAAIEACIDNIPELSEYFLYANDDMFFSAPTNPEDFFDKNNNPIVHLRKYNWTKPSNLYTQRILYTQQLFSEKYKNSQLAKKLEPAHCIDAYRKSYFKNCKKVFSDEFDKLISKKFRAPDTIQRLIFSLYAIEEYGCSLKIEPPVAEQQMYDKIENLYIEIGSNDLLEDSIKKNPPKLLCINDTESTDEKARKSLKQTLANIFFEKQDWEIQESLIIEPVFKDVCYSIVFSFDNKYCKYFAATLQSIIQNSANNEKYDIVVFNSDITENNKQLLLDMIPPNFNLRFFDISNFIVKNFPTIKLKTMKNWTVEMYNRIFIPLLMPYYEKVLYLDTDMVINSSLKELFDTDFETNQIIAVKDVTAQVLHLSKYKERCEQIKNCLKLKNETKYFNSGMIVFNIPSINKNEYIRAINKAFKTEKLLYPDQDILNIIFEDKTKLISSQWNFCPGIFIWNKDFTDYINAEYLADINNALKNPFIIHYTSPQKPWNSALESYYQLFWKYARQTAFYEDILYEMNKESAEAAIIEGAKYTNLYLQIQSGEKVVFWGASIFLEEFIKKYSIMNTNIIGIIDKNPNKKGKFIGNYEIFAPEDIAILRPEIIIITIVNSAQERALEVKEFIKEHRYKNVTVKTI